MTKEEKKFQPKTHCIKYQAGNVGGLHCNIEAIGSPKGGELKPEKET